MGTQKTRLPGAGDSPEEPLEPQESGAVEEDLGLTEGMGNIVDDPSGFVANAPIEAMYGRRVRPMSNAELERAHHMQAGNVPMFGQPSIGDKDGKMPEQPISEPRREEPRANPNARRQAEVLMPDYLKDAPPQDKPPQQNSNYPSSKENSSGKSTRQSVAATAAQQALFDESTAMIERLLEQEAAARNRGDYQTAAEARQLAESIAEDYEFERVVKPKEEHPGLKRLRARLGLEQIKPASVNWAGFKWMFAVTNARLDRWVGRSMNEDNSNLASLIIASSLIGIDDVPLYDFLSIPIEEEHTVTNKDENGNIIDTKKVTVSIFKKFCICGAEVKIDETECYSCKAKLNIYDVPTDLRMLCAERFYNFLEEDFGPYEGLPILIDRRNELMKSRQVDMRELYPLAFSSQEAKTTTSSQSGDES